VTGLLAGGEFAIIVVSVAGLLYGHSKADQWFAVLNETLPGILTGQTKKMKNTLVSEHIVEPRGRIKYRQTDFMRNFRLNSRQLWAAKQFLNGFCIFHFDEST
jgi:hypothetical protein